MRKKLPKSLVDRYELVTLEMALAESDVLVMLVDHDEFKSKQPKILPDHQSLIDTKGIWTNAKTWRGLQ